MCSGVLNNFYLKLQAYVARDQKIAEIFDEVKMPATGGLDIVCEPEENFVFTGDFLTGIKIEFTIKNNSPHDLIFKLKTTTPHLYVVKPRLGELPARRYMVVDIILLPFNYKPESRQRDKFLLQVQKCRVELQIPQAMRGTFPVPGVREEQAE